MASDPSEKAGSKQGKSDPRTGGSKGNERDAGPSREKIDRDKERDRERTKERERAKEREREREQNQKERSAKQSADKTKEVAAKSTKEAKARSDPKSGIRDLKKSGDKARTEKDKAKTGSASGAQIKDTSTKEKNKRACDSLTKQIAKDPKASVSEDSIKDLARAIGAKNIAVEKSVHEANGKTTVEVRIVAESADGELSVYSGRVDAAKADGFQSDIDVWREGDLSPNPEFTSRGGTSTKANTPKPEKLGSTPSPSSSASGPKTLSSSPTGHKRPEANRPEKAASGSATEPGIKNPNKAELALPAAKVLQDILKRAGEKSATVTRTTTTVGKQARQMYKDAKNKGVGYSYGLYGRTGDQVIKVFEENKDSMDADQIISKMEKKIEELGLKNITHHGDDSKYVIDIDYKSIDDNAAFERAVKATAEVDTERFFKPPKDQAYHIEIPKSRIPKTE